MNALLEEIWQKNLRFLCQVGGRHWHRQGQAAPGKEINETIAHSLQLQVAGGGYIGKQDKESAAPGKEINETIAHTYNSRWQEEGT